MVAEEVIITLSGGAPWGFRLQGGVEHEKPLQVAKVRQVTPQVGGRESSLNHFAEWKVNANLPSVKKLPHLKGSAASAEIYSVEI